MVNPIVLNWSSTTIYARLFKFFKVHARNIWSSSAFFRVGYSNAKAEFHLRKLNSDIEGLDKTSTGVDLTSITQFSPDR